MEVNKVIQGDCLIKLKELEDNSIDSIVTDPPYHLVSIVKRFGKDGSAPAKEGTDGSFKRLSGGFMGKTWDGVNEDGIGIAQKVELWKECLRVLKPGGHLLAFSGTRTYHRMAVAIEDAGFEVRDMIEWVYGSGFPKSHNIGKNIEKIKVGGIKNLKQIGTKKGIKVETGTQGFSYSKEYVAGKSMGGKQISGDIPVYEINNEWEGWGTALKPAHEPICMARKPLDRWWKIKDDGKKVMGRVMTVAENCLKWGTGGINIDESRVEVTDNEKIKQEGHFRKGNVVGDNRTSVAAGQFGDGAFVAGTDLTLGRFPANLILGADENGVHEEVRECFPETKSSGGLTKNVPDSASVYGKYGVVETMKPTDSGNASRFFKSILYYPKASKSERNKNTNNYLIIEICVDNTEVAQLQPRVILEKTELWFTELFGKEKMEEYQMDFKSTIKTETKKTTILVILNYSQHLNIKEYIVGAIKTKTENGGSPVASVANISEWIAIITDELMAYLLGVNPVVSPTQLRISVNTNNFHSTVKPIALMEYLIKMVTKPGGIVLDPFAGSGSTLVAAKQNGYKYIGIELTEEYIPIIEARLNSPTQNKLL